MGDGKPWKPPDGGYGWMIVAVATTMMVLATSNLSTFGVLYVEFIDYFSISKSTASLYSTAQFISFSVSGVFCSPFIKQYGCRLVAVVATIVASCGLLMSYFVQDYRLLYITYGIIPGISWSAFYMVSGMATQQYFDKKRGIAAGIVSSGVGIGTLTWPLVTRWGVDTYGWRGTILLFSAIMLNGLVCGALLRPVPAENENIVNKGLSHRKKSFCQLLSSAYDMSVLKNKSVCLLSVAIFLYQMGHLTPFIFIVARAHFAGIGKNQATILLATLGFCTTFSRPVMGLIGDHRKVSRVALLAACFIGGGLCSVVSYLLDSFVQFMIYVILYGIVCSGYPALHFPVNVDLVGIQHASYATGIEVLFMGIASVIAPTLVGIIGDATDMNLPFLIFGFVKILAGLLVICIFIIEKHKRNQLMNAELQSSQMAELQEKMEDV